MIPVVQDQLGVSEVQTTERALSGLAGPLGKRVSRVTVRSFGRADDSRSLLICPVEARVLLEPLDNVFGLDVSHRYHPLHGVLLAPMMHSFPVYVQRIFYGRIAAYGPVRS